MENTIEKVEIPKPSKKWWKGKLAWMKNKYLLAGAFFLVWMLFFDPKDISSSINRWQKYKELQESERKLTGQIDNTKAELGQLKNNARTIEKYAREKYMMKKDNEDLFIIDEPKEENK
jgi:cell division protein DivIC